MLSQKLKRGTQIFFSYSLTNSCWHIYCIKDRSTDTASITITFIRTILIKYKCFCGSSNFGGNLLPLRKNIFDHPGCSRLNLVTINTKKTRFCTTGFKNLLKVLFWLYIQLNFDAIIGIILCRIFGQLNKTG